MQRAARVVLVVLVVASAACHRGAGSATTGVAPDAARIELQQEAERQIVRRGKVRVETDDVQGARVQVERVASALGGQIAQADVREPKEANYVIRVPSRSLEPMMDSVAQAGSVKERTISAMDVTSTMVDSEARAASLRASRDRLRQLIDRAGSVQEVVTVERELARVQSELESLEARLAVLKGQVALSELGVRITRRVVLGPIGWVAAGTSAVISKLFVWR